MKLLKLYGVFICSDCLVICNKILDEDDPETS